jgi:hypothetical protein
VNRGRTGHIIIYWAFYMDWNNWQGYCYYDKVIKKEEKRKDLLADDRKPLFISLTTVLLANMKSLSWFGLWLYIEQRVAYVRVQPINEIIQLL